MEIIYLPKKVLIHYENADTYWQSMQHTVNFLYSFRKDPLHFVLDWNRIVFLCAPNIDLDRQCAGYWLTYYFIFLSPRLLAILEFDFKKETILNKLTFESFLFSKNCFQILKQANNAARTRIQKVRAERERKRSFSSKNKMEITRKKGPIIAGKSLNEIHNDCRNIRHRTPTLSKWMWI